MSKYENDSYYEHKFVCINRKDVLKSLNGGELHQFDELLRKIHNNIGDKEYLVVNQDEPYADKVWDLIKEGARREIVAFIGRGGSGKDYQCNLLVEKGYKKLAFADALRDIAFSSLKIEDRSPEHYDELKKYNCIQVADSFSEGEGIQLDAVHPTGHYMNFRTFLELLGTEGIRKYDNDFWCRALVKTLEDNEYKKVCISDMRFPNEYHYLKDFADKNDYDFKVVFCDYHSDRYQVVNEHESAKMGNWFASHGYQDLQIIDSHQMAEFERDSIRV